MRKIFLNAMLFLLLGVSSASAATFKAGEHYTVVAPEPTNKPLVQEFFSYGCGGCRSFDPIFKHARRMLGREAGFEYVPVDFGGGFWTPTQELFLVLEALGRREELHDAVFAWFFGDRQHARTAAGVQAFMERQGVDKAQFEKVRKSFAVHVKKKRYDTLTKQYQIRTTPTVVVNGKYRVEHAAIANSDEFVQLLQHLLQNP